MAPHSSTLAWKIPWTEEPGRLQSMRSLESDTTEWLHFHFSLSCIGGGNGNPFQYSCLENPRDGGAWWAAVFGVAQSRTRLKQLSSSSSRAQGALTAPVCTVELWPQAPQWGVCPVGTRRPGCLQSYVCTVPWTSLTPNSGILFSPSGFLQQWPFPYTLFTLLEMEILTSRSPFPSRFLETVQILWTFLPASQLCLLLESIWAEGETKNRKINKKK